MSLRSEMTASIAASQWNVRDEYKACTMEQLRQVCDNDRLPFAICMVNVSGDLNIGMSMRSASLLGAEKFLIFGSKKYDRRSTVGAQNYIDVVAFDAKKDRNSLDLDYSKFDQFMDSYNYYPVMFDTGGIPVDQYNWIDRSSNKKPCLVFGNEGLGLPEELTKNKQIVTIPQLGVLRSLNVGIAASIAMYEAMKQLSS